MVGQRHSLAALFLGRNPGRLGGLWGRSERPCRTVRLNLLPATFAFLLHAVFLVFGSHVSGLLCSLPKPEETNSVLSSSYWSVSGTRTHKTIAHTHVFYMIISNSRNVCTEVNVSPGNSTPRGVSAAQTSHGSKWLVFLFANKLAFQERTPGTPVPSLWCYFYTGVVVNMHGSHLVESFQLRAETTHAVENKVLCYIMLTAC